MVPESTRHPCRRRDMIWPPARKRGASRKEHSERRRFGTQSIKILNFLQQLQHTLGRISFTQLGKSLLHTVTMHVFAQIGHSIHHKCHVVSEVVSAARRSFHAAASRNATQNYLGYSAL